MPVKASPSPPGLLEEGDRPPLFMLPDRDRPARLVGLESFRGARRVVLLFLASEPAPNHDGRAWLRAAVRARAELAARDLTILVFVPDVRALPLAPALPDASVVLHDVRGAVAMRYGGAPAFYLVGKDGGIKWAARRCPALGELFALIDAMPMRRREMREREGERA